MTDRSSWPRGPWDDEGDREEWTTAVGLPAMLLRSEVGAWCGYVGVPSGHRLRDVDFGVSMELTDIDVHGGITFTGKHSLATRGHADTWWIGFDCAHWTDVVPSMVHLTEPISRIGGAYRTQGYAREQCESLARQIAGLKALEIS